MRALIPVLMLACRAEPTPEPFVPEPDTDTVVDSDPVEVVIEPPAETPLPDDGPFAGLPCAEQRRCAEQGPFLEESCCARGDAIEAVGTAIGHETVGMLVTDAWAVACGGFGAQISRVSPDARLTPAGTAGPRCQHAALGETLSSGERLLWLAHHGDTWVTNPTLWTFALGDDAPRLLQTQEEPGTSFGGLAHRDGLLYVAVHSAGLRVYEVGDSGSLTEVRTVSSGLSNVREVQVDGDHLYVTDGDALTVLSLTDPREPVVVGSVPVRSTPRHVDVHGERAWLALGAAGVDVFDVSDPAAPVLQREIELLGSAQEVSVTDRFVAVAAWDHVVVLDPDSGALLGTERTTAYPHYEQDLAIDTSPDGRIFVGEWEGTYVLQLHDGLVAPDVWSLTQSISFDAEEGGQRALQLLNRGRLPLQVLALEHGNPAFTVPEEGFELPPGGEARIDVAMRPPTERATTEIYVASDDPDMGSLPIPAHVISVGQLREGDVLDESFAFLDPTGAGQLDNMRGQIWLLAYFALF